MNVSLPEELRTFVDEQVEDGRYGSTSEYVRADPPRPRTATGSAACFSTAPPQRAGQSPTTPTSPRSAVASNPAPDIMAKPVRLRRLAVEDIDAALDHYRSEAGHDVAGRFVGSVERAISHVGRHPHHGSLRFAYGLEIPDLRCWPLPRFPYLIMYVERDTEIDVWRVLHTGRDIPSTLAESTEQ